MNNTFIPLLQREWLQHRMGWLLLAGVPVVLTLLALISGVGTIKFDDDTIANAGTAFPLFVALATMMGTAAVVFGILWLSSLFIATGLARRDHADRSVEFWLSVPVSHARSLGVPLAVHTLLVPAAALFVSLLGGYAIAAAAVTRLVGFSELFNLPWPQLVLASVVIAFRLLGGLLLATLWLSPLIMLTVLMSAWFRRWGWVIMVVVLGVGGAVMDYLFGQQILSNLLGSIFQNAAQAFITGTGQEELAIRSSGDVLEVLSNLPSWAFSDWLVAVRKLASPLLVGGVLFAVGCFYLLVQWRQRGASAAD
jgi:ABC-2 type transport system permease protein